jgi:hypothetical protein
MGNNIRDRIIDYSQNAGEIEKWLSMKGDEKYSQFADLLDGAKVDITWENISNLYRYDKRLLVNNFLFMSFFEEYLRVIIIKHSDDKNINYSSVQRLLFSKLISQLFKLDDSILKKYFDCVEFRAKMENLRDLRNGVAHSHIIIQIDSYKQRMNSFYILLPVSYRENYEIKIKKCTNNLVIPDQYVVKIEYERQNMSASNHG